MCLTSRRCVGFLRSPPSESTLTESFFFRRQLEYKHKKLLKDIKRQGPNRFVNITRRSVKVEYAAKDHWRW